MLFLEMNTTEFQRNRNMRIFYSSILIIFTYVSIGLTQITRYDELHITPGDGNKIWGSLRQWSDSIAETDSLSEWASSLTFYRAWDKSQRIDWSKSKMLMISPGGQRDFVNLGGSPDSLQKMIVNATRRSAPTKKEKEWRPSADLLTDTLGNYLDENITLCRFITILDTMLDFRFEPRNVEFDRVDISLKVDKEETDKDRLRISSLNYLTRFSLPDNTEIISLKLAPWVKDHIISEYKNVKIMAPNLIMYYSASNDNYYFDPIMLQKLLKFHRRYLSPEEPLEISFVPVSRKIPPDQQNSFLPSHTRWQRSMALLDFASDSQPSNPLYNTVFALDKSVKWYGGFWEDIMSHGVLDAIKQPNEILKFPGIYSFTSIDSSYKVFSEDGRRSGNLIVLPKIERTHNLGTLDMAVADIDYRHVLHLQRRSENGYETVIDDTSRFVMSRNIEVEVEPNSRSLINVEIVDKPTYFDGKEISNTYSVAISTKHNVEIFNIARRLNDKIPKFGRGEKVTQYFEIIKVPSDSIDKDSNEVEVAKAYFRYIDSNSNPLQPDLGDKIGKSYWHVVYIYPPEAPDSMEIPLVDRLKENVKSKTYRNVSVTTVLLGVAAFLFL